MLPSICQQIWKTQQWPQDWKRSIFIPIPNKDNAKECSKYHTTALISHASTLAWKIPWTEEPGRLKSMRSLRVEYNWATSLSLFIFMHWRRKWQPAPVFLAGESQGWQSLMGCRLWGWQSRTRLKQLSSSSRMGENNSKQSNWKRINLKNIQAAQAAQFQKNKRPKQKNGPKN